MSEQVSFMSQNLGEPPQTVTNWFLEGPTVGQPRDSPPAHLGRARSFWSLQVTQYAEGSPRERKGWRTTAEATDERFSWYAITIAVSLRGIETERERDLQFVLHIAHLVMMMKAKGYHSRRRLRCHRQSER